MSDESSENEGSAQKGGGGLVSKLIVAIVVIGVVATGGYYFLTQKRDTMAIVNGEKISLAQYNERYSQIEKSLIAQGKSATSTEVIGAIKKQATEDLITEAIILQEAKKENIVAKEDEVKSNFDKAQAQFASVALFQKALTDQGYTEDTFKSVVSKQNVIQQYLSAHIDLKAVTASETEVKELYDQAKAANKDVPVLKEVRAQVEAQIVGQKQRALISQYIDSIRAKSAIQVLN